MSIHEADLKRLDDWAGARGITRSRAVVALLDLATGETESREQREARERGLLAKPLGALLKEPSPGDVKATLDVYDGARAFGSEAGFKGRYVDDSEDFKQ